MKLKSISVIAISCLIASFVIACDNDNGDPQTPNTQTCIDGKCYNGSGISYECSSDKKSVIKHYNPNLYDASEVEKFAEKWLGDVVNDHTITSPCAGGDQCVMDSNNEADCYTPCQVSKAGDVSWCEPYSETADLGALYTSARCELVGDQYVTKSELTYRYCPQNRTCSDDTGCTWYSEDDGTSCTPGTESSCVDINGQTYAKVCAELSDTNYYLSYEPCEICVKGSTNYPTSHDPYAHPYCLKPCDQAGATKYTRAGDNPDLVFYEQSTQWTCKTASNGRLYWQVEKTENCNRGVGDDGKCIRVEGEDEACDPMEYVNKCVSGVLLICQKGLTNQGKTTALNCKDMGSGVYKTDLSCATSGDEGFCVPSNPISCTNAGEKKTVCNTFEYGTAATVNYICKEINGSLIYVPDIPKPVSYVSWVKQCASDQCNADGSNCL